MTLILRSPDLDWIQGQFNTQSFRYATSYSLPDRLKERIAGIGIVDHSEPGC